MSEQQDIYSRLQVAYDSIFYQINDCARHCASYRSSEQREGYPEVIAIQWEGAQQVWNTRDALRYRAGSLIWHVDLLLNIESAEAQRIADAGIRPQMDPNVVHHALSRLGYAFDDLIFNSVSLFDYLAKFVCSFGYEQDAPPEHEWKSLANRKQASKLEHEGTGSIIIVTHRDWVRHLIALRSTVIHNKPEVGTVTCKTVLGEAGPEHSFYFYAPEKVVQKLPTFLVDGKYSLAFSAAAIALQAIVFVSEILKVVSSHKYQCINYPARRRQQELQKASKQTKL